MKIDQLDTPFLYLDEDGDDEAALIHPAYLETHVPTAKQTGAPRPHKMQVKELQDALGVVEMDADGCAILERPKWGRTKEFEAQRQPYVDHADHAVRVAGVYSASNIESSTAPVSPCPAETPPQPLDVLALSPLRRPCAFSSARPIY